MKERRFIEIDGCINCEPYNDYHERKLQLHEAMSSCLLLGCQTHGHTILNPYIGSHELKYILENKAFPSGDTVTNEILDRIKQLLEQRESQSSTPKVKNNE